MSIALTPQVPVTVIGSFMKYLDLEVNDLGSCLIFSPSEFAIEQSLLDSNDPKCLFNLEIVLPLRIQSVTSAKWKKKRRVLDIDCVVYTVESGMQPSELVDNCVRAREEMENEMNGDDDGDDDERKDEIECILPVQDEIPAPQPIENESVNVSRQELFEKYSKLKVKAPPPKTTLSKPESLTKEALPPSVSVSALTSTLNKPQTQVSPSREPSPLANDFGYTNHSKTVQSHPTNHLGLISPHSLILIIKHLLVLASSTQQPSKSINSKSTDKLKSIMESFLSDTQKELCRLILVQAVPFASKSSSNSINEDDILDEETTRKFLKLAEFQMRKIAFILQKKYDEQLLKNPVKPTNKSSGGSGGSGGSSGSSGGNTHAPVFTKNSGSSTTSKPFNLDNNTSIEPTKYIVSNKNQPGGLFTTLLQNPKGTQKRIRNQTLKTKASKTANILEKFNVCVLDDFLDSSKLKTLLSEITPLNPHYTPSEIWVGSSSSLGAQISVPSVRGDKVVWMCGGHSKVSLEGGLFDSAGSQPKGRGVIEPCDDKVKSGVTRISSSVMTRFNSLKQVLSALDTYVFDYLSNSDPRLKNITSRSDAMLAVYPGGGSRFQRHVDNTASDGRRLTVLLYLNDCDWSHDDGGMLRVWTKSESDDEGGEGDGDKEDVAMDVLPLGGRIALFYSDVVPHEVTSSNRTRIALTVWYYDADEREDAVNSAKQNEEKNGDEKGDLNAQNEASEFIRLTLTDDDKEKEKEMSEELNVIGKLAKKLSSKAVKIVAGIVGAPSAEAFVEATTNMTADGLVELRESFKQMGV